MSLEIHNEYSFEKITRIADFLKQRINITPKVGIICGSGLGSMGEAIEDAFKIDYSDIPNFPISTVIGHKGCLIFGKIEEVPVMCMQGRFHYYEGYPLNTCVMPVRLMRLLGATHLITSNAAGGLNPNFKLGDIMLIKDHINFLGFAGVNPLRGPNDERFGVRFVPISKAYDSELLNRVKIIGREIGMADFLQEGVYTCVGGPNYETIAELRALKVLGVDSVGMSTVHEVIAAKHCGMTAFAFSLITNICVTDYASEDEANAQEVLDVAKTREADMKVLVQIIVQQIGCEK